MKKITAVLLATLLGMFMVVGNAGAWWIDSELGVNPDTLSWVPTQSGVCWTEEDGLDPVYGGQGCDVEAMYFKAYDTYAMVSIVTGFHEDVWPGYNLWAGDIAFDFGMNGTYERGIRLSDGGLFDVGSWSSTSPYDCDPLSILAGSSCGSVIDPLLYALFDTGSDSYVIEAMIPLDFLLSDTFQIHWTMSCGNDGIDLACNPVPEPASMMLFGTGLLGLVGFGKRKFFS